MPSWPCQLPFLSIKGIHSPYKYWSELYWERKRGILRFSMIWEVRTVLYNYTVNRGVTKICRLSWLTNSALEYEPKCGGGGRVAGSQPMSTAVHSAHGVQINFGDLTPYLTYGINYTCKIRHDTVPVHILYFCIRKLKTK